MSKIVAAQAADQSRCSTQQIAGSMQQAAGGKGQIPGDGAAGRRHVACGRRQAAATPGVPCSTECRSDSSSQQQQQPQPQPQQQQQQQQQQEGNSLQLTFLNGFDLTIEFLLQLALSRFQLRLIKVSSTAQTECSYMKATWSDAARA
eukprot:SAG11_NODE_3051_length_2727_cov_4.133181_2_plen_147_part_00